MKKLYLIRHAKSSWKDMTLDDFDRPLNKRGKKDAPFMAKTLKQKNINPDILISSPAIRAKKTALYFQKEFNKHIKYFDSLYHPSVSELENIITSFDDSYESIFLFSHNPGLNQLAFEYLDFNENIPTSAILGIKFDCNNWKDIISSKKELLIFDYPKRYKNEI